MNVCFESPYTCKTSILNQNIELLGFKIKIHTKIRRHYIPRRFLKCKVVDELYAHVMKLSALDLACCT